MRSSGSLIVFLHRVENGIRPRGEENRKNSDSISFFGRYVKAVLNFVSSMAIHGRENGYFKTRGKPPEANNRKAAWRAQTSSFLFILRVEKALHSPTYLDNGQSVGGELVGVAGVDLEGDLVLPGEVLDTLPGRVQPGDEELDHRARHEALPGRGWPGVRPRGGVSRREERRGGDRRGRVRGRGARARRQVPGGWIKQHSLNEK